MDLIAVPNVSEGRDPRTIAALRRRGQTPSVHPRILDVHSDPDHGRTVFTIAGKPGELSGVLAALAQESALRIDLRSGRGAHPHVGVLDVAPVVFLDEGQRPAALAEALLAADRIAETAGLPVFLYGLLAHGRTRAELRRGGVQELQRRVAHGELAPDFGPPAIDPARGAVLVAARPPLIAFNLELAPPATLQDARAIAARVREGGDLGLPGVRAIGLLLPARHGVAQVSCNVEDHRATPLARLVGAVRALVTVAEAEVVGLPPAAAFAGYPEDLPTRGRRTLEQALARASI